MSITLIQSFLSLKVHIQLTFYHAVVELSALMGFFAEELFKLLMRGDDIALSAAALSEHPTHFSVNILSLTEFEKSLAVRGITYYD